MEKVTVLSLEQALSLPYATLRMVHRGWRVIRVEAPAGDPNRRIGAPIGGADRGAYFVPANCGKEAIVVDLQQPAGRDVLHRVMKALSVDVFCCNTLPGRYEKLGIDDATLRAIRPQLIWAAISAMGPAHPDVPGYDPALQAMVGFMDLTGAAEGPPQLCGVPLIDLKAGDEVYAEVLGALWERSTSGQGKRIDVSMARAAVTWLLTVLPMLDTGARPGELTRSGAEHRQFVPSNVYPTKDGFLYLAVGNDRQWESLTALQAFSSLKDPALSKNEARKQQRKVIHERVSSCTRLRTTSDNLADMRAAGLVCSAVNNVEQVAQADWLKPLLNHTVSPDGTHVRLPPTATGANEGARLPFAPRQGEHTRAVLREAGFRDDEIGALATSKVIGLGGDA